MNGPFQVAQASAHRRLQHRRNPCTNLQTDEAAHHQAVMVNLGYDQKVKVDFSAIANEKITLVHVGEKLIILFDNQSTVTVEPVFKSRADGLVGETRDEITRQSALDWDPLSASKRDPFERRVRPVALAASELAGVAETVRARVV